MKRLYNLIFSNQRIVRRTERRKQRLEVHWFMFGIIIWKSVLDTETIPRWAYYQVVTLGSTDWKSKFREYIN